MTIDRRHTRSTDRHTCRTLTAVALLSATTHGTTLAADQTQVGAGNATAVALAMRVPLVQSAMRYLVEQAEEIRDRDLKAATLDILKNPGICVIHRRGLATATAQDAVVQRLLDKGLINSTDATSFPSGIRAAIFPPLRHPEAACPQLPQPFESAVPSTVITRTRVACGCTKPTTTGWMSLLKLNTNRASGTSVAMASPPLSSRMKMTIGFVTTMRIVTATC